MARLSSLRRKVAQGQLLLEFDHGLLRYALGSARDGGLELSSIGRIDLPSEALERGVPTDPAQMAGLIRELCQEHQLYANQVSVVLPPDAALMRVVELPADLSLDQARERLLEPALGLQLPIPLIQTDFDLVPCQLPLRRTSDQQLLRRYLLLAVPRELTAKVLSTMEQADLHLQRLEVAPLASMRLKQQQLRSLARAEVDLWLELLPGRSVCTVVAASGPVAQQTLVAIRDFPEPDLDTDQSELCINEGLRGEDITVRDSRYLPLSDLDLRVLVAEIKAVQAQVMADLPDGLCSRLWISGINSAHPLLEDLLAEQLDLEVQRIDPLADPLLAKVSYARLLLCAGLSRLIGLALGVLPPQNDVLSQLDDFSWQVESDHATVAGMEIEVDLPLETLSASEEGDAVIAALPGAQSRPLESVDRVDAMASEVSGADLSVLGQPELEQSVDLHEPSPVRDASSAELPDLVFSFSPDDAEGPPVDETLERPEVLKDDSDGIAEESRPVLDGEEQTEWPSIDPAPDQARPESDDEWPSIKPRPDQEMLSRPERTIGSEDQLQGADVEAQAEDAPMLEASGESSLGELRFSDET